jgi:predicted transcriptional regulator
VNKSEIRVESVDTFFARGRRHAKAADHRRIRSQSRVVAFEDVRSLLRVLTDRRVVLLKQVQEMPSSITFLAQKLNRDRSAVARDVQLLERFGVVEVSERPLPGHGRQK